MQFRAMSAISSAVANPTGTHLRKRYVVAIALSLLVGVSMSVWLAVDAPVEQPARTSYLPAD